MSEVIPYIPDLDKILEHSQEPTPRVLSPEEYDETLAKHGLHRGTKLSDVGILKAMEAGLIKVWTEEGDEGFDLMNQIQSASLDLRLGSEFWYYRPHEISSITAGEHVDTIRKNKLLTYVYKLRGEKFTFHTAHSLVLAFVQEGISLSNVVTGQFDGRSKLARLGVSNHQTAGGVNAGFGGRILTEISNTNMIDICVRVGDGIGSIGFTLLDQPSTRPENLKTDSQSHAYMQASPFGFRLPEWDKERERVIALSEKKNGTIEIDHTMVSVKA